MTPGAQSPQDGATLPTLGPGRKTEHCQGVTLVAMPHNRRRGRKPDDDRDTQALLLRQQGLSFRQIQLELGLSSTSVAYDAVQRAIVSVRREPADSLIRLEAERLDRLTTILEDVLAENHYAWGANGQLIRGEDGTPVDDQDVILRVVDRLLKVQERRAKLLGLDAPTKQIISLDAIEAEIAELEREAQDELAPGAEPEDEVPDGSDTE